MYQLFSTSWRKILVEVIYGRSCRIMQPDIQHSRALHMYVLPGKILLLLCCILFVDHASRVYSTSTLHGRFETNFRVADRRTCRPGICIILPIAFIFGYKIPLTIFEMISITAWPSFCILLKTRTLLRENIRRRINL